MTLIFTAKQQSVTSKINNIIILHAIYYSLAILLLLLLFEALQYRERSK